MPKNKSSEFQMSAGWRSAGQISLTVTFAVALVWLARAYGRSLGFAFGVNWLLMAWAILIGGLRPLRLPAGYYSTRSFEKGGRVYDLLGVRWYQRIFRRMLWSVDPANLRSQPQAREAMIRATYDPETGHLLIFVVIVGVTVWTASNGWWNTVAWLLLFNLIHNAYPVLSMRQIRARLNRTSRKLVSGVKSETA